MDRTLGLCNCSLQKMDPGNRGLRDLREGKSQLKLQPLGSPNWRGLTGLGTEAEGHRSPSEDMAEDGDTNEKH